MKKNIIITFFVIPLLLQSYCLAQPFVASKNSNKYHLPSCRSAIKINPSNLLTFKDADEAAASGYIPCKVCKPPTSNNIQSGKQRVQSQEQWYFKSVGDGQCQAITKKGTQCKRKAQAGSNYCWQHNR